MVWLVLDQGWLGLGGCVGCPPKLPGFLCFVVMFLASGPGGWGRAWSQVPVGNWVATGSREAQAMYRSTLGQH